MVEQAPIIVIDGRLCAGIGGVNHFACANHCQRQTAYSSKAPQHSASVPFEPAWEGWANCQVETRQGDRQTKAGEQRCGGPPDQTPEPGWLYHFRALQDDDTSHKQQTLTKIVAR